MSDLRQFRLGWWLALLVIAGWFRPACAGTWTSPATGGELTWQLLEPATPPADGAAVPVVFYLVNLAAPRVGTEPDEPILRDLRAEGLLVVVLDYAGHPRATLPWICTDLVRLREDIRARRLLADRRLDPARIYQVPAGCRLRRNVVFYRDPSRTLELDVVYPSKPRRPVGALLEFSCDNENRMGNFSLTFCTDSLVPAAALAGHAAAMADHPVAAPYQGLDAMPDCAYKAKAAVRVLRALAPDLGLNGRIVPAGFSRGSGMALLLATTAGQPEFADRGEQPGVPDVVQGAVVMSGRFTYLDLLAKDPMIPRYVRTWGDRAGHEEVWRRHGALDYLSGPTVPLFLTINVTEAPEALHQMEVLRRRLETVGSPFVYHPEVEPRGHKMPLDPAVLDPLFSYLQARLSGPGP